MGVPGPVPCFSTPIVVNRSKTFASICAQSVRPREYRQKNIYGVHIRRTISAGASASSLLESEVLTSLKPLQDSVGQSNVHKYKRSKPESFEAAKSVVSQLERSAGGFGASRLRKILVGTWRLIMTDSVAVEKNGGSITGLGSLPGARCTWVEVVLGSDGKAKTVEGIEVFGGMMSGENQLVGRWELGGKGGRTLEVTYAKAILMGRSTIRADSKAVLETTYCGEKIRVARNSTGEVYVFERK